MRAMLMRLLPACACCSGVVTQVMKFAARVAPRAVVTTGRGTTGESVCSTRSYTATASGKSCPCRHMNLGKGLGDKRVDDACMWTCVPKSVYARQYSVPPRPPCLPSPTPHPPAHPPNAGAGLTCPAMHALVPVCDLLLPRLHTHTPASSPPQHHYHDTPPPTQVLG
jgi:hypothetical protein